MNKRLILIVATLICSFSSFAAEETKQPLDKIVAIVNDSVITNNELNEELALVKETLNKRQMSSPPENVLRKQVLEHMIDTNLELQMAKNAGIQVDSHDIDEAIDKIAQKNHLTIAQLRQAVEGQGLSWKSYRHNVKKEIIISELQQKVVGQIVITDQQVENYLSSNAGATASERNSAYHIEDILIPLSANPSSQEVKVAKTQAEKVLSKLKNGANFNEVAVAESGGENALEGGDLGYRQLPELPEAFAQHVVNMKPGELSSPIRLANGFHIIKLVDIRGGGAQNAPTKEQVKNYLYQRKYNEAIQNWLMQLRNSTYIKTYLE
jgi:peptidyl-prolyl cis-trans isomerase SurA